MIKILIMCDQMGCDRHYPESFFHKERNVAQVKAIVRKRGWTIGGKNETVFCPQHSRRES